MQTVRVTGTTLYRLAAQYLGDATQWVRIAQQNGIADPVITGDPVDIVIPDKNPAATGGVPAQ